MSTETADQLTLAALIIKCACYFEGKEWQKQNYLSLRSHTIMACIAEAMRRRGITMQNAADAMRCPIESIGGYRKMFTNERGSSFMEAMASSFANPEKFL